ncbi:hypothetical protein BC008_16265 [Mastigocoleus testarum BC008]|uniref:CHAT domain-containing protein n=2 Tax=Mastigocoleus TaxID=996924 RepID=A0A0V7ZHC0_9CYAN|nr:hypothetical protein BC008_15490 [Mastigocoleus testarum BC008]KST64235.1 hypothetical protein BC008_16265 [Mastigocoleus testarum BC008]
MGYYKIGRSVLVSSLVVLSASFVPKLPMVLMTSGVLAQTMDARTAEADRLFQQGNQHFKANQLEAALQCFQKALIIFRDIKNRKGEAMVLANLGSVYSVWQDYPKAIDYYKKSLTIALEIKNSELEAIVQPMLAKAQLRSNPQKRKADRLHNQGKRQYRKGQLKAALLSWKQALQIYRKIKDRAGEGSALNNLGLAYNSIGEYKISIEFFQESLVIVKELGNRAGVGSTLTNLGIAYDKLGKHKKAIEYYQQSLGIFKDIGSHKGESRVLTNLGIAYGSLGDNKRAIEFFQKSLVIVKELSDRAGEAATLDNLGGAYNSLGDYRKAIGFEQQSLVIAREIGDRVRESSALSGLGTAYYFLRDYRKAIGFYHESLAIDKEIGDRAGLGSGFGHLGNVYNSLGEYQNAIDFYQQSLVIAREIGNHPGEGALLTNMGLVYNSLEDYKKAIELHKQSLVLFKKIGDRDAEGSTLNNLGLALFKSKNFVEAEKVLKYGVEVRKSQRSRLGNQNNLKISIFEKQANIYSTLQQVLIAQNKTNAALEVAESGRARAFVDLMTSRLSPNSDIYSATEPTINQIKQIANAQNSTLVQYSIIGEEFKVAGKGQTKESKLYIWVIKPTGEVTFRKADLKPLWQKENTTLGKLVSTTRKSLGVSDDERNIFDVKVKNPVNEKIQKESLQKLHQLLVKPIADLLPTDPNQRVTFVPQGDLFLVPFPALMDSKGKYLIEKHTILTAPAIQVLELTRQQQKRIKTLPKSSRKNALIVGNPTMPSFNTKYGEPGKQLPSLPGAKREAEAIAPLFYTIALTGDEATETAIKAKLPQAGLIHLATHGLFDGFQGLQSSIALAPSSQDNGLLTASEILDIKLNADLVVLSACNTGRGRITGDGVIGLSRSLISSGVPSVLVSLWSVPDSPTASLMTDFYQNLSKNPDKATALRQAMLTRMKQHPNPRDWAAFTLIGEAE